MISEERVLVELLQRAGNTVVPSADALERIRARIAMPRRPWWRRALLALTPRKKNGAPGWTPGTPDHCKTDGWKEPKAMTIIQRRAREVRAGDIITADPDHNDRPVRWRVADRPTVNGANVAVIDCADLDDQAKPRIAWFDADAALTVERDGGQA